jgi:hypothetical protein
MREVSIKAFIMEVADFEILCQLKLKPRCMKIELKGYAIYEFYQFVQISIFFDTFYLIDIYRQSFIVAKSLLWRQSKALAVNLKFAFHLK